MMRTARAFEALVGRDSFGELLAQTTENVIAMVKIGSDAFDLVLRNLRLAGRQDITRLARQLARNEDKLELVLQEIERLQERLDELPGTASRGSTRSGSPNGRGDEQPRSSRSRSRGGGS